MCRKVFRMGEKLKFKSWADILLVDGKYVFDVKDFGVQGMGITLDNAMINAQVKLEKAIKEKLVTGEVPVGGVARHYGNVLGGIWVNVEVLNAKN